jgi:protein SCO1/2
MRAMIGGMLRVLVIALVLLVGVMLATTNLRRPLPEPELASYFATPLALPAFELVDTHGASLTPDRLRGRFTLLFFGFTNCPDICPLTLAALASAYAELATDADPPQVVFVSVDPNRDTPERIGDYLAGFDDRFIGATGTREQLDPLLRALGVSVMIHELPDRPGYTVTHNGTIYMIGPDAELVATLGGMPPPAAIASDFRRVQALHQRRSATTTTTPTGA